MSGRYIATKVKTSIIERAKGRCEYCQSWMRNAIHTFHIDHIIPLNKDGKTELDNLALSCAGCNGAKSDKTMGVDPVTKLETPLFNPRLNSWKDHFVWSDDALEVLGLTPVGRTTVEMLRLNRKGLINMRRLTKIAGEHPPE